MNNYKQSDLKFFKNVFKEFENEKLKKLNISEKTSNTAINFNTIKDLWSRKYNFELRNRIALVKLNTDSYEKKRDFINKNCMFDKKYCTMHPKDALLGPQEDKNFSKKLKKIGDISFEETDHDLEVVRNLKRTPPDHISEEWLKENLNHSVDILRLDNCYWLSKDLVSKIGRIAINLKV